MRGGEADALKGGEFAGAFRKLLRDVAANAPGALQRDSLMAGMEFSSLYSPTEIVSGICAAEDAGLSVEQGVICLVMLVAAIVSVCRRLRLFLLDLSRNRSGCGASP
jgi:hypothetical protein